MKVWNGEEEWCVAGTSGTSGTGGQLMMENMDLNSQVKAMAQVEIA